MGRNSNDSSNANPSPEGTPISTSENGQLQWIIASIAQLNRSSESLQGKFDTHIDSMNKKMDDHYKLMVDKITEKSSSLEGKIESKHQLLEVKLQHAHDTINNKHDIACEKMANLEPSIINKINESQKTSGRWVIGLLVALSVGVVGVLVRLFVK